MSDLNQAIGEKIKLLRSQRRLTLDQAAELTGVSKSMIGQIERGNSAPTVTTLWKICNGFKVSFSSLLEPCEKAVSVVRKEQLQPLTEPEVYRLFSYIPFDFTRKFEAFRMELPGRARHESDAHTDAVEEFVYVTEGRVAVRVDDEVHQLKKDDLLRFGAQVRHRYTNLSDKEAGLFIIIVYQ
jgi:transcriptional regulator with XRE-family HTH domain